MLWQSGGQAPVGVDGRVAGKRLRERGSVVTDDLAGPGAASQPHSVMLVRNVATANYPPVR
jgi:hypothetical protein